jgi:hypothetical protein
VLQGSEKSPAWFVLLLLAYIANATAAQFGVHVASV